MHTFLSLLGITMLLIVVYLIAYSCYRIGKSQGRKEMLKEYFAFSSYDFPDDDVESEEDDYEG